MRHIFWVALIIGIVGYATQSRAYDDGSDYENCQMDNEYCIKYVIVHDC